MSNTNPSPARQLMQRLADIDRQERTAPATGRPSGRSSGSPPTIRTSTERSADVRELASRIDSAMSRRGVPVAARRNGDKTALEDDDGDRFAFEWRAEVPEPARTEAETMSAGNMMRLVRRKRTTRVMDAIRHGFAWIVTLFVGGAVAACATYLMIGTVPDLGLIMKIGARAFM